jgi:hypothetical protein
VIEQHGLPRVANSQLRTFWKFERLWACHSPGTHRLFRRFYNRLGPQIAARVKSRFVADVVYLALKPFEAVAILTIRLYKKGERRETASTRIPHSRAE